MLCRTAYAALLPDGQRHLAQQQLGGWRGANSSGPLLRAKTRLSGHRCLRLVVGAIEQAGFRGAGSNGPASAHWRDLLLFHGDTGRGLGASHQTGWTALVARLLGKASQ